MKRLRGMCETVKILLSTFHARILLFAQYSVRIGYFEFCDKKRRNRRVSVASVSKVTRSCFQLVKTGKEQFQMKVSRASSLPVCLSLYFPSYQSASYRLVSTQNQCLDPANYDLFPDRRSYFYWSLHDHLIHDSHRESDRFAPMSKIQGARHYAIDIPPAFPKSKLVFLNTSLLLSM